MLNGRQQLEAYKRRSGLQWQEIAQIVGMSQVHLSQVVNGHKNVGLGWAFRIERTLGIQAESWLAKEVSDSGKRGHNRPRKTRVKPNGKPAVAELT